MYPVPPLPVPVPSICTPKQHLDPIYNVADDSKASRLPNGTGVDRAIISELVNRSLIWRRDARAPAADHVEGINAR